MSAIARATATDTAREESDDLRVTTIDGAIYRKRRMRPARRWGLMLLVLSLIVAGVYGYQRYMASRPAPIPRQLRIDLTTSGLYCPQYIAWSPDSLSLAVIADAHGCGADGGYHPSTEDLALGILNARTGALEKRIEIISAIPMDKPTAVVTGLAWSRDSATVYVALATTDPTGTSHAKALFVAPIGNEHASLYSSPSTSDSAPGVIWNLTGQPRATMLNQPLAPARTYTLSAGGVSPDQPFSTDLTSYTGTANPPGAISFWQAGTITPSWAPANSPASLSSAPMALLYDSLASQMAPDGATLASGLWLDARIPAPSPPAPAFVSTYCLRQSVTQQDSQHCPSTVIPYSDKALAAVAAVVEQGVRVDGGTPLWWPANVAWRPDGKLLAAILPAEGYDVTGNNARVTIYSASAGAVVARFTAPRAFPDTSFSSLGISPVQWSPSGQQIALVDWASSAITVWDARSLRA